MEQNPIRIAEILLGLKDVNLIGVEDPADEGSKAPLRVHIECRGERPKCPVCNGMSYSKGTSIDLEAEARVFAAEVADLLNRTVTDGMRLAAVVRDSRATTVLVGYGISFTDVEVPVRRVRVILKRLRGDRSGTSTAQAIAPHCPTNCYYSYFLLPLGPLLPFR